MKWGWQRDVWRDWNEHQRGALNGKISEVETCNSNSTLCYSVDRMIQVRMLISLPATGYFVWFPVIQFWVSCLFPKLATGHIVATYIKPPSNSTFALPPSIMNGSGLEKVAKGGDLRSLSMTCKCQKDMKAETSPTCWVLCNPCWSTRPVNMLSLLFANKLKNE